MANGTEHQDKGKLVAICDLKRIAIFQKFKLGKDISRTVLQSGNLIQYRFYRIKKE